MRRRAGVLLMGVAVAAAAAAGLSAGATSAAPLATMSTLDVTYSCPVQKAKVVNVYAGVKFRPANSTTTSPGALGFDTGIATKTSGGTTTTKSQASVVPQAKNGVTIDKKNCRKLKTRIPFSAKRLPILVNATPTLLGYTSQACDAAKRVIFRLQVHITGGKPTSAVLAIRNADAKRKPIALVSWSQKKVSAHFARACTSLR